MTENCVHSRAWHTARKKALDMGMTKEQAKEGCGACLRMNAS